MSIDSRLRSLPKSLNVGAAKQKSNVIEAVFELKIIGVRINDADLIFNKLCKEFEFFPSVAMLIPLLVCR